MWAISEGKSRLSEFTFSIQSLLPNDFKMVTAAPSINSSPVWFFYQWSPSAGLWATIVFHDYCSNKEDWKIKYLTSLIFTIEVRSEYGLVSQQCLQSSTQYTYTHTLLTWGLNTIYHPLFQEESPTLSTNHCMMQDLWLIFCLLYDDQIWQLLSDHLYR